MRRHLGLLLALASLFTLPASVRADLILSISSPDDLAHVAVGATVTFDISVFGTSADAPGYLSTSIQIDPTVFADASVILGSIIPDARGFDSSATGGGTVSAYYDDSIFGTAPITTDGVFYSFRLTRIADNATTLSFSGFSAQDDSGNNISISADPDSIDVPATRLVPEPSSLVLAMSGMGLIALAAGRRTRVSRSN